MPQIKSQKKRVKTNNKRHLAVASQKSALKTAIKNCLTACEEKNKEAAVAAYNEACSKLDKAVAKGLHHKQGRKQHCIKKVPVICRLFLCRSISRSTK